jgi:catechol 2,3-dioxygenase-like lactoylglutathione lyase family enzyme
VIKSHATVLLVDDVARAFDYYTEKLGFEGYKWEQNPSHYAYVNRDNCWIHFACFSGVPPRPNSADVPPDMFDLYVYVEDVEALHEELRGRGADILFAPLDTEYGLREIRVRDPFGYILAFGKLPE